MQTKLDFQAVNKRISDVLFDKLKIQVPRYQRPYTWGEDELTEFWNDVSGTDEESFLGSLIFNYENYAATELIEVIDGQQRLLTITILAAVMRDIAKSLDHDRAMLYHTGDIAIENKLTGEHSYRIIPGDRAKTFFLENIQKWDSDILQSTPMTGEELRIKKNYEFLHNRVSHELENKLNNTEKLEYLDNLRTRLWNLIVIHIQISNEEEAYEIFETTNARGVDLSISDLLKNLIFKHLPPKEDQDLAKTIWEEITNTIETTNTEMRKFIRYYWISKYPFVTEKKLFKIIKQKTTKHDELLCDLRESTLLFQKIIDSSPSDWDDTKHGDKIYDSIEAVRLMNVTQCFVFFLSILRNIDKLGMDPYRIFGFIEKFTFQYSAVSKQPGNKVERIYSKYANAIEQAVKEEDEERKANNINGILQKLKYELKDIIPSKETFMKNFSGIEYKKSEQSRKLMKYILSRINNHQEKTDEYKINWNNVNLEHLLPQKPSKNWGLKESQVKAYVHKLGNLTIVDKTINSKIGNKSIRDKITALKVSRLPLNQELISDVENNNFIWDENSINERITKLAKMAFEQIWKMNIS